MVGCLFLGMLGLPFLGAAQEQVSNASRRFALVVGNLAYSTLPAIPSAIAEARLMKDALESAGFAVTHLEDLSNDDFFKAEALFLDKINVGDICLFYYSGHGIQIIDDDDYLLPVDFLPQSDKAMEDRAFRLTRLIQDLDQKQAALKILIIEAPHRLPVSIKGASGIGLAIPEIRVSKGTFIAFAAGAGHFIVKEGKAGEPGLFTQSLSRKIAQPGLALADLFDQVKQEVGRAKDQQQLPEWSASVLPEGFYFHPPVSPKPAPPTAPEVVIKQVYVPTDVPRNRKDRLEYVHIPAGHFKMGCVPGDVRCDSGEQPQHEVTVSHGFWMGRTEVEVSAYQRFVEESNKKFKMPKATFYNPGWKSTQFPMILVPWEQASAYCGWAGGRLPTEAEWEYAARGGNENEIYPLGGENSRDKPNENSRDKANFTGKRGNDIYENLAPVHSFDPNGFSLYDMAGNVWEWVADWYSPTYFANFGSSTAIDPPGPDSGKQHVKRGGSFESSWQKDMRISVRESQGTDYLHKVGFRCVLDESESAKQILNLR
jgi:formylglycine-generating enzyme required for sulfatase activity